VVSATPLTPEAVASLTDAELSEAVARVVLGAVDGLAYSEENDGEEPEYPFYDKDGEGNVLLYSDEWEDYRTFNSHPPFSFDDPRAVDLVLEHMRQRWAGGGPLQACWRWKMEASATGKWYVYVLDHQRNFVADFVDKSMGRAILSTALLAAQEMEKEG
jgi:hypothetical protein